ncbi:MAG TPA: hypothetical protein VGJ78_01210 [Vicinamibacterales bacterium]|jgi:hypothetical protein
MFVVALALNVFAQGRGAPPPGRAGGPPPSAKAAAPFDPTGYWVAIVSEDWRWRMVTPAKGDVVSIPLSVEGLRVAEAWDPAKDEAAGEQCRAYGAPGLMRGPTRLHITWQDDNTLKVETDYGTQTRLLRFTAAGAAGEPGRAGASTRTWQGVTTAQWTMAAGGGRGRGAARHGSIKSVTTQMRPGYLRKNGVPYGDRAVFTEYWDLHTESNGDQYLVDTNLVEDPVYLQAPWITALHFKKEKDGSKWDPSPCDARF